jgi:hypothetical protein
MAAGKAPSIQFETDTQPDLVMGNFTVLKMAACFDDLEPIQITHGFRATGDGVVDCIIRPFCRRSDDFEDLIHVIAHQYSLLSIVKKKLIATAILTGYQFFLVINSPKLAIKALRHLAINHTGTIPFTGNETGAMRQHTP